MSRPKGAPPPGWRPTVKGKTGGPGSGDVLSNAAQGGSVLLPEGGAPVLGSRFGAAGARGPAAQPAQAASADANSDLRELFGGELPNYGMWAAQSGGAKAARAGRDDEPKSPRSQPGAGPRASAKALNALFEDLDEPSDKKATGAAGPAAAAAAAGRKAVLPEHYPSAKVGPDYSGLFEKLQHGGKEQSGDERGALFRQPQSVPDAEASLRSGANAQPAMPSLPRATLGGGQQQIRRGSKLVLDLDSFLVDCAVDWGRERAIKSFNLAGKADEGVSKWSETMQSRGVLTADDFGGHGVELDLSDSTVIGSGYSQLEKFAGAVKMDLSVTTLRVTRAQLGNTGCSWLAGGMMKNRTLRELILSENGISDEGIDGLAAVLDTNSTLTLLDLGSNQIASTGAGVLADGLKRNRKLRELNLGFNKIDDGGAIALADAVDPTGSSTSVLRTLNLEGNPLGKPGVDRLVESFNKKGTMLETLLVADQTISTKKEATESRKRKEPEKFIVICSETGVDIRAAGVHKEQVSWIQEDDDIEITFKEGWLQKRDTKTVRVDFGERRLRIEIKNIALMDAELHGNIRPKDCMWTLGDGIMQVILAKADRAHWPNLTSEKR